MTRKTKENVMIHVIDWNSYLKNLYESRNALAKIPKISTEDDVFFLKKT